MTLGTLGQMPQGIVNHAVHEVYTVVFLLDFAKAVSNRRQVIQRIS